MAEKHDSNNEEIAYLIVGVAALIGVVQLWRVRIQPWLVEQGILQADGGISTQDLLGIALLLAPLLVLALLVRGWLGRRAEARQREASSRG